MLSYRCKLTSGAGLLCKKALAVATRLSLRPLSLSPPLTAENIVRLYILWTNKCMKRIQITIDKRHDRPYRGPLISDFLVSFLARLVMDSEASAAVAGADRFWGDAALWRYFPSFFFAFIWKAKFCHAISVRVRSRRPHHKNNLNGSTWPNHFRFTQQ